MSVALFTGLVLCVSTVAGALGSLTGLGGGVVMTPVLTLLFAVDIRYAIGASLVSAIATSSGSAVAYVRQGYSNIRLGMFLEIATTLGALLGAYLATMLPGNAIGFVFGLVLLQSAWEASREHRNAGSTNSNDLLVRRLRLEGTVPSGQGVTHYLPQRPRTGFALMILAGTLSGLLGIGSGALKVLAMDRAMRVPFKASTATSNFMIGVTAAASAGIYLKRGYIDPGLAMPVMLGVLAGSILGTHLLARLEVKLLRRLFAAVVAVLAVQMLLEATRGRI